MNTDTQNDGMIRAKAMRFSRDPRAVSIVNQLLITEAMIGVTRPAVDAIKRRILNEKVYTEDTGEQVTEPEFDWRINDDQCAEYYERVNGAMIDAGWKAAEHQHCPALVLESRKRKQEQSLIQYAAETVDENYGTVDIVAQRKELLRILIGLVVSAPGYRAPTRREKLQAIEDVKNIC